MILTLNIHSYIVTIVGLSYFYKLCIVELKKRKDLKSKDL